MSKRAIWLCVAFTACSVYEPSLLGTGRNAALGGGSSVAGSGFGGFADAGEAGEGTVRGGATSGGTVASGGSWVGGAEGGSDETGGSGAAGAGTSEGGSSSGASGGGSSSGGTGGGGATSGGKASGGAGTGATPSGGSAGSAGKGGATSGGSSGGASKGGSAGSAGMSGGGVAGGQSGGSAGTGGSSAVLFSDDFERGNAAAWTANTSGDWSVITDGSLAYRQNTVVNSLRVSSAGNASWQNQAVQARVKVLAFGGSSASSSYFVGVYARYADENNHYYLALRSDGHISIRRKLAGSNASIGGAITPGALITTGKWYTVKLEISGTTLKSYVDGVLYDTVTDTSFASGKAGLGTNNASAVFDDFVVTTP